MSKYFDLGIATIQYKYTDSSGSYVSASNGTVLGVGREVKFKLHVRNYDDTDSPDYKLVVYDENGNKLDEDNEISIYPRTTNYAYLYVAIDKPGKQTLKFAIETDDDDYYEDTFAADNVRYKTFNFTDNECYLGIKDIKYRYTNGSDDYKDADNGTIFEPGQEIKFKVLVVNYEDVDSPDYEVAVYDEDGIGLDHDLESSLEPGESNNAYFYLTVNTPRTQKLKFIAILDEPYAKSIPEYRTFIWSYDGKGSGYTWSDLGSPNYLSLIEDFENSALGVKGALFWMCTDLNDCNSNGHLEDFKRFIYLDDFCNKFNDLVLASGLARKEVVQSGSGNYTYTMTIIEDEFEEIHYIRNLLNKAPSTLQNLLEDKGNWQMLPFYKSAFHMKGDEGIYNLKFVSKGTQHHEAVYDKDGRLVTDIRNMGTYNFVGPDNADGHILFDVETYYKWGSTEDEVGKGAALELAEAGTNLTRFLANNSAREWYSYYAVLFGLEEVKENDSVDVVAW